MAPIHRWKFFRSGGVDQVALRDAADLLHLGELDLKLWVALAMPTRGVEIDARTLDLIDTDHDGRVRAPEILAAVQFLDGALKSLDDLKAGADSIALDALKDGPVKKGALRILENLGRKDAPRIALEDVADTAKIFAATRFNGDGVVPADAAGDDETRKVIEEIIAAQGAVADRSGKPGVDQARIDVFFKDVQALAEWRAKADAATLPLGEATHAAAEAVRAVRGKVDDYFTRGRLAAIDPRTATPFGGGDADLAALTGRELSAATPELARLPLARIEAGRALPLGDGVNPAWSDALAALATRAVGPLVGAGKTSVSEAEWRALTAKLAAYDAWWALKPSTPVEALGPERTRALAGGAARAAVEELVAEDLAVADESNQIESVERLVRLHRDLWRILHNFVNFADFYARKGAVFQVGQLFLDGRTCHLCVPVHDAAKHAALAGLSASYLAYLDCTRPGGEKITVAAAFTDGDSDNLMVGRNGVFFDRKGRDWDATITKVVTNPISIREAFWSPYKKFVRMIDEQIGKRAAAADAANTKQLDSAALSTAHADKTKAPEEKKIDVGTVAAIGVAVGGIGALLTGVLGTFFGLGVWMPIGIVGLVLMISGPSMLLAVLKLRQRNLGPILDANGWAINGRARINVPFGGALTDVAHLPKGASRAFDDPYAEKRPPWRLYVTLAVLVVLAGAWYLGKLDRYLPEPAWSTKILGANAPAARQPPQTAAPSAGPATP